MGEQRRRRTHGSRRRRRKRLAWIGGAVLVCLLAVGVTRCLPQGLSLSQHAAPGGASAPDLAAATLVIYNDNDPLSLDLAYFYAEKRGIAREQVVGLKCSTDEEISREQYDNDIATPLRALFDARGWWVRTPDRPGVEPSSEVSVNRIRFVALIRGMPLKVRPTPAYAGDFCKLPSPLREHNEACVDSEIAVLGRFTRAISGPISNPYFRSYQRFADAEMPWMMLVARLDAPTGGTVRRMITDSIAAEKNGLWGRCYVDARGLNAAADPMAEGDAWIRRIARADGAPLRLPTVFDNRPAIFSTNYPMTAAALYFGWYTQDVAGPFTREDFHFQPGAVAFHLHSFSATSARDPAHWWVAPLLQKGAAATLGNVYEPYLGLTTHFDLFAARLFDGSTLAESAYAGTPGLSWMNVVIGDPLYRPSTVWQEAALDSGPSRAVAGADSLAVEGRAYLQGAQTWRASGAAAGAAALQKCARQLRSGLIFEGLAFLQSSAGDEHAARVSLDQALRLYRNGPDQVRVILTEARTLSNAGQTENALALLRASGKGRAAGERAALDEMVNELAPAPSPPPNH